MKLPFGNETRRTTYSWAAGLLGLALLAGAMWMMKERWFNTKSTGVSAVVAPVAVPRTNLVLLGGRLRWSGQTNVFTGLMLEHYPDGSLRSRSAVTNGQLHGLSEGRYTNGQVQVTEQFKEGVSHGPRMKWYADGTKLSEAMIVNGRLHGRFQRWHANGQLAEDLEIKEGQPDGLCKAYFPSGYLKSRTTMRAGSVVEQKLWKDGEEWPVDKAPAL